MIGRRSATKRHKRHKFLCAFCAFLWLIFLVSFESGCRSNAGPDDPEPGVSEKLATKRAQSIEALSYELSFTIPATPAEPITGHEIIKFSTRDVTAAIRPRLHARRGSPQLDNHRRQAIALPARARPHHHPDAGTGLGRQCHRDQLSRGRRVAQSQSRVHVHAVRSGACASGFPVFRSAQSESPLLARIEHP